MPKYDEVVMTETPTVLFEEMKNITTEIEPSRLVEFPGATRSVGCSQWRKDLSERVRQIQERRVRDLKRGINNPQRTKTVSSYARPNGEQPKGHPLGLVPSTDAPPMNPLVIAALKRIERARQPAVSSPRPRSGGSSGAAAATATARVIEEHHQPEPPSVVPSAPPVAPVVSTAAAAAAPLIEEQATHAIAFPATPLISTYSPRTLNLVISAPKVEEEAQAHQLQAPPINLPEKASAPIDVAPKVIVASAAAPAPAPAAAALSPAELKEPQPAPRVPRRVFEGVVDEAMLARREATVATASPSALIGERPLFEGLDDRALLPPRIAGSLIDLLVIVFASSPFAAVIELTSGDWADLRVTGSMLGIFAAIMFLYLSIATLLAGRTWGMSLVSIHPADVRTGLAPTTKQAVIRTLVYMASLAICGLGLIYAFFDPEGRTAHDHLSGTVVLKD